MLAKPAEGPAWPNSFENQSVLTAFRQDQYLSELGYKLMAADVLLVSDIIVVGRKRLKTDFKVRPKTMARLKKLFRKNKCKLPN